MSDGKRTLKAVGHRAHLKSVGLGVGQNDVWVNGYGETGPIDAHTAHALESQGGWADVSPAPKASDQAPQPPGEDHAHRPKRHKGKH